MEPILTCHRFQDDRLGRRHLRRPELALRNSRIAEGCLNPWLHDRGHGPYVSLNPLCEHQFADSVNSHVDRCCIPSPLHASRVSTWHGKWYRGTRRCRCLHPLISLFVNDTRTCIPLLTSSQAFIGVYFATLDLVLTPHMYLTGLTANLKLH
jgi:hypothetical protein